MLNRYVYNSAHVLCQYRVPVLAFISPHITQPPLFEKFPTSVQETQSDP